MSLFLKRAAMGKVKKIKTNTMVTWVVRKMCAGTMAYAAYK